MRRWINQRRGLCATCGYDLRAHRVDARSVETCQLMLEQPTRLQGYFAIQALLVPRALEYSCVTNRESRGKPGTQGQQGAHSSAYDQQREKQCQHGFNAEMTIGAGNDRSVGSTFRADASFVGGQVVAAAFAMMWQFPMNVLAQCVNIDHQESGISRKW